MKVPCGTCRKSFASSSPISYSFRDQWFVLIGADGMKVDGMQVFAPESVLVLKQAAADRVNVGPICDSCIDDLLARGSADLVCNFMLAPAVHTPDHKTLHRAFRFSAELYRSDFETINVRPAPPRSLASLKMTSDELLWQRNNIKAASVAISPCNVGHPDTYLGYEAMNAGKTYAIAMMALNLAPDVYPEAMAADEWFDHLEGHGVTLPKMDQVVDQDALAARLALAAMATPGTRH